YTSLSQSQSPDAVSSLLDAFYDECANAIWAYDGLLNKTIGDAVMAVFNFPMVRAEHPGNAVRAARDIQKKWRERREALVAAHGLTASELGIGIGIHSGELSFGEFGHTHRDLTAIGTVVNTASRAQSVAEADQILVTKAVFDRTQPDLKPRSSFTRREPRGGLSPQILAVDHRHRHAIKVEIVEQPRIDADLGVVE